MFNELSSLMGVISNESYFHSFTYLHFLGSLSWLFVRRKNNHECR